MRRALAIAGAVALALAAGTAALAADAASAPPASGDATLPAFKIAVEETAAYRVRFEDLVPAGLAHEYLPSAGLGLTSAGEPVPIWVEDGGDGVFGPGDHLEFVGRRLAGEVSYLNEDTRYNIYRLRFDAAAPARMTAGPAPPASAASAPAAVHTYRTVRHLEDDLLILRLPPPPDGRRDELWYWAKLTHNQQEPFTQTLDLHDLAVASGESVDLALELRGWSQPRQKVDPADPDHHVDVVLNGAAIATAAWNGTDLYRLDIPALPRGLVAAGNNTLTLQIPQRAGDPAGNPLVDVVMLNWIEIAYPRSPWIGDEQARLELDSKDGADGAEGAKSLHLASDPGRDLLVFGAAGWRAPAQATAAGLAVGGGAWIAHPPAGERSVLVTPAARLATPAAIVLDRPSRLADPDNHADYIVIAHSTLLDAVQPLAALHRARGLAVEVVDVEDVYDELSHGIVDPRALRAFIDLAYHRWRPPAPRFVLLVGDASWDGKNARAEDANYADWTYRPGESSGFVKNGSTPYATGSELNRRDLIPTWNHATGEGHSASDNWFVAVDGDDDLPDLAIGRFPVLEPAEVEAIVRKTVAYVTAPEAGPWRRDVLLITNDDPGFQHTSDSLAGWVATQGLVAEKIYPGAGEASNERNTRRLQEALDHGTAMVHFFGHGGRYIWRTGPPDLEKNHDLFTLDDLDRLQPHGRLPVVLSMTCYSAPFDHPNADSIGEKLLRLPDRGAIAVVAASWRNAPTVVWGSILIAELSRPGATIGEAVMRAKHQISSEDFVATYNLLGDPAAPVARPAGAIALTATAGEDGGVEVTGEVETDAFAGQIAVDLVDERGEVIRGAVLDLAAPRFATGIPTSAEEFLAVRGVRAYAWDTARGFDAAAGIEFTGNAAQLDALAAAAGPTP